MANPFAAAAAKASTAPAKKQKGNVVEVPPGEQADAILAFIRASEAFKEADTAKEMAQNAARPGCKSEFLKEFASDGDQPETMKFRVKNSETGKFETVTLIVQDKGGQYKIDDGQLATITAVIGPEKASKLVVDITKYEFDNDILNKPGVMEALGVKLSELVAEGKMTGDDLNALLVAKPIRTTRKGILGDLAKLCGSDPVKMDQLMGALGSHVGCYIKA